MSELLKGNYSLAVDAPQQEASNGSTVTDIFEARAMEHLGGSIAFVMKGKRLVWDEDAEEGTK